MKQTVNVEISLFSLSVTYDLFYIRRL
jgi:hypothetical protein